MISRKCDGLMEKNCEWMDPCLCEWVDRWKNAWADFIELKKHLRKTTQT